MATATYEPIATQTLASAAASITFSSIAASWTDLRVILVTAGYSAIDRPALQYNSDTATNYSYTTIDGIGTGAYSNNGTNYNYIKFAGENTIGTTSVKTLLTIDIFSYAGSAYKTSLGAWSDDENGNGAVTRAVGLWRSSAAITSVTILTVNGSNMSIGTTATLYGIKSA